MTTIEVCDNLRPLFKKTKRKTQDRLMLNKLHNKHLKNWDYVDIKNYNHLIKKYAE